MALKRLFGFDSEVSAPSTGLAIKRVLCDHVYKLPVVLSQNSSRFQSYVDGLKEGVVSRVSYI